MPTRCWQAAIALGHSRIDVQEAALAMITRHGGLPVDAAAAAAEVLSPALSQALGPVEAPAQDGLGDRFGDGLGAPTGALPAPRPVDVHARPSAGP